MVGIFAGVLEKFTRAALKDATDALFHDHSL
jgi:hypothetical protein